MKNEKDFKTYISEIAAKIAEAPADTRRLRSYQARKDKGAAVSVSDKYQGIKYKDVPGLSGLMKRKADQIVAALEEDLMDQVKTASIYPSKGRYENSIIFKIEFENLPTFVGIVSADPEDLPEPKGVTGFEPPLATGQRKDPESEKKTAPLSKKAAALAKGKMTFDIPSQGMAGAKTFDKEAAKKMIDAKRIEPKVKIHLNHKDRGWLVDVRPVLLSGDTFTVIETPKGSTKEEERRYNIKDITNYILQQPRKSRAAKIDIKESFFSFLSEVLRNEPIVKAGFASQAVTNDAGRFLKKGSMQDLETNTSVSPKTKKMINVFLQDVAKELLSISAVPGTSVQKTLDTIKKKAKVANKKSKMDSADLKEYESGKVNLPNSIKAQINSAIADEKDMAQFVLDMIMEIIPNEKAFANLEKRAGWTGIFKALKVKSGENSQGGDNTTPDVSADDMKKSKLPDVPALQEAYERIKRK
jgi:hypothetical protein